MSKSTAPSPDEIAKASAKAMWAKDTAVRKLGLELTHIAAGEATITAVVTETMANGHGSCHGGYIFLLADSAFAYACNSHNTIAVAQHCSISFIHSVAVGDRLTATAREISRRGRSGLYDVRITNQHGAAVAEFRGHSRVLNGHHVPEAAQS